MKKDDTIEIVQVSEITPDIIKKYSIFNIGKDAQDIVFNDLRKLSEMYPRFNQWYYETVTPEIGKTREIFLAMLPETIAGIAICKKTEEKKICTLKVRDGFFGRGIGQRLFDEGFRYLEDVLPTFTVSSIQHKYFLPLIQHNNFKLVETLPDYYIKGVTEFVYNHHV